MARYLEKSEFWLGLIKVERCLIMISSILLDYSLLRRNLLIRCYMPGSIKNSECQDYYSPGKSCMVLYRYIRHNQRFITTGGACTIFGQRSQYIYTILWGFSHSPTVSVWKMNSRDVQPNHMTHYKEIFHPNALGCLCIDMQVRLQLSNT